MHQKPLRLAIWSGPRNISTALMRSWGNRPDTFVCDEPLYAHYLLHTKIPHPGAAEVIQHHETDWPKVAAWLTGPIPDGKRIFYQKHMAHHLLPRIDRAWLAELTHCFLIRDPGDMLSSLLQFIPQPSLQDTGLPQQVEICSWVRARTGKTPPILDARDVLTDPRRMLTSLCNALAVEFMPEMLAWPPGRRATDGVWAKYWYAAVEKSAGFQPHVPKTDPVSPALQGLLKECVRLYMELYDQRLQL
jgi:hypothetical protein